MTSQLCYLPFQSHGGCSIVENTITGLDPDLRFVQKLSKDTGIHVIAGTGDYRTPPGFRAPEYKTTLELRPLVERPKHAKHIRFTPSVGLGAWFSKWKQINENNPYLIYQSTISKVFSVRFLRFQKNL